MRTILVVVYVGRSSMNHESSCSQTSSISLDELRIIKGLLLHLVDDVQRSLPLDDAGWVIVDPLSLRNACEAELCYVAERGVRVSPAVLSHHDLEARLDEEGKYLFSIFGDITNASELEQALNGIANVSDRWAFCIGLQQMLYNSEFPIAPERVIRFGIPPDDWQTQIAAAIPELALTIANRFWGLNSWSIVLERLKTLNLPAPEIKEMKSEQFERVKAVLEWQTAVENMSEAPALALGLVWYADYLIGTKGIQAPEAVALVQRKAWAIAEKTLGMTSAEVRREIDVMTEKIDEATREKDQEYSTRPIASWVDIIRLP